MSRPPRIPSLLAGLVIVLALGGVLALADGPHQRARQFADAESKSPPPYELVPPKRIATRLEALRELEFEKVPEVRRLSAGELRDRTAKSAERGPKKKSDQQESAAVENLLRLSGLATADFVVEQATKGVGELIGGFYRPMNNRLVLVETPFQGTRGQERVIAHEFEHALQDQNYPKSLKLAGLDGEAEIGLSSLVEGDASVIERRYARRHLEAGTADADKSLLSPTNLAVGLPPALAASVRFPYTAGADFVAALQRRGGWTLVDHAFADPPTTSEQILHPGKWIAGEDGVNVSTPDASILGPDWESIASVDSGELDALVILAAGVPADVAERAAAGWEGGRFEAYQLAGTESCHGVCRAQRAVVVSYLWDTEDDAAEFAVAARRYIATRLGAKPSGSSTFEIGDGAASLGLEGRGTAIAFAPSPDLSRQLATAVAQGGS